MSGWDVLDGYGNLWKQLFYKHRSAVLIMGSKSKTGMDGISVAREEAGQSSVDSGRSIKRQSMAKDSSALPQRDEPAHRDKSGKPVRI